MISKRSTRELSGSPSCAGRSTRASARRRASPRSWAGAPPAASRRPRASPSRAHVVDAGVARGFPEVADLRALVHGRGRLAEARCSASTLSLAIRSKQLPCASGEAGSRCRPAGCVLPIGERRSSARQHAGLRRRLRVVEVGECSCFVGSASIFAVPSHVGPCRAARDVVLLHRAASRARCAAPSPRERLHGSSANASSATRLDSDRSDSSRGTSRRRRRAPVGDRCAQRDGGSTGILQHHRADLGDTAARRRARAPSASS